MSNFIAEVERTIGYSFDNKDLLRQAFVRKSYVLEGDNEGEHNEILEFIGDKVLDLMIVRLLTGTNKKGFGLFQTTKQGERKEYHCRYDEHQLTEIKRELVCSQTLSICIEKLGFEKYLLMGNGDIKQEFQNQQSVKEDLFEAIIGAVALDSDYNYKVLEEVIDVMLDPTSLLEDEDDNPVNKIQEWTQKKYGKLPEYTFSNSTAFAAFFDKMNVDGWMYGEAPADTQFTCKLKLGNLNMSFRGYGTSKRNARKQACEIALKYLEQKGCLFTIRNEIEEPSLDLAINQLETLSRRGYFDMPIYEYEMNVNQVWTATVSIEGVEATFSGQSALKKIAKKEAAFLMLKYILEKYEELFKKQR